jgi:hypothetical protein
MVAKEQRRFAEAEDAYRKALEIYVAFEDSRRAGIALLNIAHLWAATGSPGIPSFVATILKVDIEQARELLRNAAEAAQTSPRPDPS